MHELSDAQLLRDYAAHSNEAAFREIVNRHAALVYSSALRQVTSPDLARDVAQSIFTDLARKAPALVTTLTENSSLIGWLYRSTRFTALNLLRDDRRRLARERHVMQHFDPATETAPDWDQVQPVLDEAMAHLSDEDRDALLLRYFKNHDFRAIGSTLGVSDDAAQKRVTRALERLRAHLTRRDVTTTALALSTALTANAVPLAPVGLAATLSTTALAGTTLAASAAIAMTTIQKTAIAATLAVLAGAGIYEARQASQLREQVQALQQERMPLAEQLTQLKSENERLSNQVNQAKASQSLSKEQFNELLKLRGKSGVAQADARELAKLKSTLAKQSEKSPSSSNAMIGAEMYQAMGISLQRAQLGRMKKVLNLTEDQAQAISELMQKHSRDELDMAINAVTGKMTPEQRQAMVAERSNPEDEIKSLLTPEQLAAYPEYEQAEKIGAADGSANAEASLIANQFDLSKEQQDQIRAGLSQVNLNEPASGPNTKAIAAAKASGNLADAASMSIELSKSQLEAKLKILVGVLTPKQIDAYREQQLRQLNMMATMMKTIVPEKTAENGN